MDLKCHWGHGLIETFLQERVSMVAALNTVSLFDNMNMSHFIHYRDLLFSRRPFVPGPILTELANHCFYALCREEVFLVCSHRQRQRC